MTQAGLYRKVVFLFKAVLSNGKTYCKYTVTSGPQETLVGKL